jgi:NADP-dependent 3-hydroxy acid dehydrogenase YdfG
MKPKSKIWIIGGSSGIGLELVKLCLNRNYFVVVSSRNAESTLELEKLKEQYTQELHLLNIDVTSKQDIKEKVLNAWSIFNGLDIWFYNAGAYDVMGIET